MLTFILFVAGILLGLAIARWYLGPRLCPRCHYYLHWRTSAAEKKKNREPWHSD